MTITPLMRTIHHVVNITGLRGLTLALAVLYSVPTHAATTIWAGTQGGVYESIDSGATWQAVTVVVTDPLLRGTDPPTPNVAAIALDPQQPSTVYFVGQMQGSSGLGFYRSADSGKTWTSVLLIGIPITFPVSFETTWILVDPVLTNVIYLGTTGEVAKSTDYGATWTRLTLPTLPNSGGNTATPDGLSVDPNASGVIYLSALPRVFKSIDFGNAWTLLTPVVANQSGGHRLGNVIVDPKNSSVLYVGSSGASLQFTCGPPNAQQPCGLFRSADGGQSWNSVGPGGEYNEVVFDSRTSDLYVSGRVVGASVLKSTDGGNTWNPISNMGAYHLIADPGASASLFGFQSWNSPVFVKSTDGGVTFTEGFIVTTGLKRDVIALAVPRAPSPRTGDCNSDGSVTVDELLTLVNIALGNLPVTTCEAGDANHDNEITIDEILAAVNNALIGPGC